MNAWLRPPLALLLLALVILPVLAADSPGSEAKLEAQLVWGSNEEKAPKPELKPVTAEIEKKLKCLPFKWQHYFEVRRKQFAVAPDGTQKVQLSKDCTIVVKKLANDMVEVTLLGQDKTVGSIKQKLPAGETLVLGGNAENFTSWFVVLRQVK